ncbi:MAG: dynamin family protein, partial [Fusobacteriaceae bacterium]
GREILPKASTPKTANLTIIKYSEAQSIEIEFYTEDDFEKIKQDSKLDLDISSVKVAKETMALLEQTGTDPYKYLGKIETIDIPTQKDLEGKLEEYAGEKGKYTAIVKKINLNVNIPELKEIEVVDTPGMNDPVISRTEKTREFMKKTDVVFFLSPTPQFLDKEDMNLLGKQLPNEGVQKLILVGSKFDSVMLDSGWDKESYEETIEDAIEDLSRRAKTEISKYQKNSNRERINRILEESLPVTFISSMAKNWHTKNEEDYTAEEKNILGELKEIGENEWGGFEFTNKILKEMANFEKIDKKFEEVKKNKEVFLQGKIDSFFPISQDQLLDTIELFLEKSNYHINFLENETIEKIKEQTKSLLSKEFEFKNAIETSLGDCLIKLEEEKVKAISKIKVSSSSYSALEEKVGTKTHIEKNNVSDSKWYNPFSWGSSHVETSTYTTNYRYIDVSDAVESIISYANASSLKLQEFFNESINLKGLKLSLKRNILGTVDSEKDDFSPEQFKFLVEESVNRIELPILNIKLAGIGDKITKKFSGEVKGNDISNIKILTQECLDEVYQSLEKKLIFEIETFRKKLEEVKQVLKENILIKVKEDLNVIQVEFENKEQELKIYKELKMILDSIKRGE